MSNVEILFKNKTTRIERAEVSIDGKKFIFTGQEAKEWAKLSNSDAPGIRKKVEQIMLSNTNK